MKEPSPYVVGLAVAVAMWFSAIVAFSLGIVLAPVSAIIANIAALCVFSALIFWMGLKLGARKFRASQVSWWIAGMGWLVPWIIVSFLIQGLSEDLGGTFITLVAVGLVLAGIPVSFMWLGMLRARKRKT